MTCRFSRKFLLETKEFRNLLETGKFRRKVRIFLNKQNLLRRTFYTFALIENKVADRSKYREMMLSVESIHREKACLPLVATGKLPAGSIRLIVSELLIQELLVLLCKKTVWVIRRL